MKTIATTIAIAAAVMAHADNPAALAAATALINRVLPGHASDFVLEAIPQENGKDVFEIEAKSGKIVLRGNDGVSQAMAFNTYLRDNAKVNFDWLADKPLTVNGVLPLPAGKVRRTCAAKERFFLNYCTYGYTMPFWGEAQWTRFVDWMAMNGINRPLLQCGLEATWLEVWKSYGIPEKEILATFTGPAQLPWNRMTNIDKIGGPLPMSYVEGQRDLQKKILAQARGLGMKAILSGFAGHVPEAWTKLYPKAKVSRIHWCNGIAGRENSPYFLDSAEPQFSEIQEKFLCKQVEMYGTDHLYAADPFNEMTPPSWAPEYMADVAKAIYGGMAKADPEAVWYQMGWTFYHQRFHGGKHWNDANMSAMTHAVPPGKMVYLDYVCEAVEMYPLAKSFYGAPFIWNYLGNFGGNTYFGAPLRQMSTRIEKALSGQSSCVGVGSTLEGLNPNSVAYEMVLDQPWFPNAKLDLNAWIERYAATRAGRADPAVAKAWRIMLDKVFVDKASGFHMDGIIHQCQPTLGSTLAPNPRTLYSPAALADALREMLAADPACRKADGYQFDVVNLTRQALGNYALTLHQKLAEAHGKKDVAALRAHAARFMEVGRDIATLLATRHEFMFGPYLRDARAWGASETEKDYYECNARQIVSTWTVNSTGLADYASRQNDGMMATYYLPRWEEFLKRVETSLVAKKPYDDGAFKKWSEEFGKKWTETKGDNFPVMPQGDPYETASRLFAKYQVALSGSK